jgi:hypothetical protein
MCVFVLDDRTAGISVFQVVQTVRHLAEAGRG